MAHKPVFQATKTGLAMENVPDASGLRSKDDQQPSSYTNRGSKVRDEECSMCGDVGLKEELFRCRKCCRRYQHTYCSNWYPKKRSYAGVCNWCGKTPSPSLGAAGTAFNRNSSPSAVEDDTENARRQFDCARNIATTAAPAVDDPRPCSLREGRTSCSSRRSARNEVHPMSNIRLAGENSSGSSASSGRCVSREIVRSPNCDTTPAAAPPNCSCSSTPTSATSTQHIKRVVRRYKLVSDVY